MQNALDTLATMRLPHGLGGPVATYRKKRFKAVPGLTTMQPYTR